MHRISKTSVRVAQVNAVTGSDPDGLTPHGELIRCGPHLLDKPLFVCDQQGESTHCHLLIELSRHVSAEKEQMPNGSAASNVNEVLVQCTRVKCSLLGEPTESCVMISMEARTWLVIVDDQHADVLFECEGYVCSCS